MAIVDQGRIDVKHLLRTLSVEELNRTADEYFKQFSNWDAILAKPFIDQNETPELLFSFAHVLQGLEAYRGMTVLDFGAGSCWASRFLTQLGYKVIATDVSATALQIGQESFRRHPVLGTTFVPTFLLYNGRRIDLPDRSVDRVVCLSALHHVPNQEQVLREFGRILKVGGIAGFAEPGPHHSQSPEAQHEMRHHTVIENDIHIEEIWRLARGAGFTAIRLALWNAGLVLVSLDDFTRYLRDGARNAQLEQSTRTYLRERRLFFLSKGPRALPDSRQPGGLLAALTVRLPASSVRAGVPFRAAARARNIGTAVWLPSDAEIGPVRLGSRLLGPQGLCRDFSRHWLPDSGRGGIWPGQEVAFEIELPEIAEPGHYRLEFDLVSEWLCWFQRNGSQPATVELHVV